jgi:putative SOS response-associated peptidase YedK
MCNRYNTPEERAIESYWRIVGGGHEWAREMAPRRRGPFIRAGGELVVGQWALVPDFATSSQLPYSTNNARFEELANKASYRKPWARGQRCIIPAASFCEPCWETGKSVMCTFRRADCAPWGLAGLWNTWTDKATGEVVESFSMLTINADAHPIMRRMHKPDPKLPADQQDKRSVVAIKLTDADTWLHGTQEQAAALARPPEVEVFAPGAVPPAPMALWEALD